jgi:hypothetical protein
MVTENILAVGMVWDEGGKSKKECAQSSVRSPELMDVLIASSSGGMLSGLCTCVSLS